MSNMYMVKYVLIAFIVVKLSLWISNMFVLACILPVFVVCEKNDNHLVIWVVYE
jgi:hypothetical protein